MLGGYADNDALIPHIWENLCVNSVENTAADLTSTDQRLPRLHEDWMTPVEIENRERQDINSTVQNRVRTELNRQYICIGDIINATIGWRKMSSSK